MARRGGHTEEQILAALRQAEGGMTVVEVCRQVGITEQTFYTWKRKYAGLGLSELRELRQLREENTKLKRLVADLSPRSAHAVPGPAAPLVPETPSHTAVAVRVPSLTSSPPIIG